MVGQRWLRVLGWNTAGGRAAFAVTVALLLVGSSVAFPDFEVGILSNAMENGRRRMAELTAKSNFPSEGQCWKAALEDLQSKCKEMSDDSQSRLALRFTSCFNEMLGLPQHMCESGTPVKECVKGLDATALATFREYFLHTQDMCYYLRQEMWQEETHMAVNRLTATADEVTVQMFEQKFIQEQIFSSQQESLQVQSNLKKDNEDLYDAVVKVKTVFDDFSEVTKEHQHVTSEIFDKLSRMQKLVSWIQGEMSLLDMVFFYFGSIVMGYFATATSRTRAARFWLIVLFMMAIWMEKLLYNYLTQSGVGYDLTPEDIQGYIWLFRKFAAGIGTLIVLISGAIYRDQLVQQTNMLTNMNFMLENMYKIYKKDGDSLSGDADSTQALLSTPSGKNNDGESSDGDSSFSNYSSDDSEDDLENELGSLTQDGENSENVEPESSTGGLTFSRFFGKQSNEQAQPSYGLDNMRQRYNLRERSSQPRENPLVRHESVTEFAKIVKRKKLPPKSSPTKFNYFSSDDDEL